jgi:hypothetical protein
MSQSRYPLRLSDRVREEAAHYAKKEHTSLNSFIEIAVAERVATLKTAEFFAERSGRADLKAFYQFLNRTGQGEPLREGDEVPEGIDFIADLQKQQEKRTRQKREGRPEGRHSLYHMSTTSP